MVDDVKSSIRGCRGSGFSIQGVAFGLDTLLILTDRKAYKLKDYFLCEPN